jgi:hypothetical protein
MKPAGRTAKFNIDGEGLRMHGLRAAQEPAEDLKCRFTAACEEVGLVISQAKAARMADGSGWLVATFASRPTWQSQVPMLMVVAMVPACGMRPQFSHVWSGLPGDTGRQIVMFGREKVRLHGLVGELMQTLDEFDVVASLMEASFPGPYRFRRSHWA